MRARADAEAKASNNLTQRAIEQAQNPPEQHHHNLEEDEEEDEEEDTDKGKDSEAAITFINSQTCSAEMTSAMEHSN